MTGEQNREKLSTTTDNSLNSAYCLLPNAPGSIICDIVGYHLRPVVPVSMCELVFDALHIPSHSGTNATPKLIAARFEWHNMNINAQKWAKTCI